MAGYTVVMVRHGESEWNKQNKFTGWYDADLSEAGVEEAQNAGQLLLDQGFKFDIAYTSLLKRAIKTLYYIQDVTDQHWIPVIRHWRLNERHYGGLQGLNKSETAVKYGKKKVKDWRRSYDIPPPPMEPTSEMWSASDIKYTSLDAKVIPTCECLQNTVARVLPYWHDVIVPSIKSGKKVLITAHGHILRSLMKYLDNISDEDIPDLEVLTGIPVVYELDANLDPIRHYFLASDVKATK